MGPLSSPPPGFGAIAPEMNVQLHEVLIVVVIIAAAIAATFARSTMAAVLSLGAVGYGVATTFLMFGAPDLGDDAILGRDTHGVYLRARLQALQKSGAALAAHRPIP